MKSQTECGAAGPIAMLWGRCQAWVCRWPGLLVVLACALAWSRGNTQEAGPAQGAGQSIHFVRDVWPILEARCVACHGPQKQRGGVRLDRRETALAGGDCG